MADFISREAAEAAMTALRQEDIDAFGMVIPECFPSASAIGALKKIPAADVRPVVRGKWIRGRESMTGPGKDRYTCSVCGEKTLSGFCGNPAKTNFCPNCGADMREVKTDD